MTDTGLPANPAAIDAGVSIAPTQSPTDGTSSSVPFFSTSDTQTTLAQIQNNTATAQSVNQGATNSTTQLPNLALTQTVDPNVFQNPSTPYTGTAVSIEFEGTPNPLNEFANYTYHIVFSMGKFEEAKTVKMSGVKNMPRTVIAESGKTAEYSIQKFSFTNTVSPGFKHQNTNVMQFKMTITEPFGMTLPDFIVKAGLDLGIDNTKRYYYFIELWFNGYTEDGEPVEKIGNIYKAWRVMMTNMDLQTTQGGTVYEITGIADNDSANVNQIAMTHSTLNLHDVKTVGDAIQKLEEELNKDSQDAETRTEYTKYKIFLPDYMKKWDLIPPNDKIQDKTNYWKDGVIVNINRGQDIGNFVLQLISKTEQIDKWYSGSGSNSDVSVDNDGIGKFLIIVPDVQIGRYLTRINDYERTVNFYLKPYYTPRVVHDPDSGTIQMKSQTQINKFSKLREKKLIAKKYEYLYTGHNTEVIKFDIAIQNFWQIIIPGYFGANTYSQTTQGEVVAKQSFQYQDSAFDYYKQYKLPDELAGRTAVGLDLINQLASGNVNDYSAFLNNLSTLVGTIPTSMNTSITNLTGGDIGSYASQASSAVTNFGSFATNTATPAPPFDAGAQNPLNPLNGSLPSSPTQLPLMAQPGQLGQVSKYADLYSLPEDVNASNVFPVTFYTDNMPTMQQAAFGGIERRMTADSKEKQKAAYPKSQSIFGSILFNIYDKTQFLNITLEIRGDPYWIGLTNLEISEDIAGLVNSQTDTGTTTSTSNDYADFLLGENMFLLTFNTGTQYNEESGFMELKSGSSTFNGLYSVLEVENHFENGSFTQILTAYKDPFSTEVDKKLSTVPSSNG
jgi:hypothetical protein